MLRAAPRCTALQSIKAASAGISEPCRAADISTVANFAFGQRDPRTLFLFNYDGNPLWDGAELTFYRQALPFLAALLAWLHAENTVSKCLDLALGADACCPSPVRVCSKPAAVPAIWAADCSCSVSARCAVECPALLVLRKSVQNKPCCMLQPWG